MSNLDPVTLEWIVAIVKMNYTMLGDGQNQKDMIDEEIASLTGSIMENKTKLNEENAHIKKQLELIIAQRDEINSLRGELTDYEEAEIKQAGVIRRPTRVSDTSFSNVVLPPLPLPTAYPQAVAQEEMISGLHKECMDRSQLDDEQRGVHDCDSCFLCIEEAKRDSPV
ncbi:hypothetical protein TrVGV298_007046 [Trichoderma virens]|nr:hypothetical protein TrVGV298_007046 [Trichoderma virens]UKZ72427.1 hypothetical protein TrVFT333_000056 [Trichoderma virens FT-333]